MAVRLADIEPSPDVFAVVMATGILSIAADSHSYQWISDTLGVLATLGLRRAHHGLRLLGLTVVIWAIEAGVWMSAAAAVGFGMDPIEGLYIVALASIFAMIPSGPAYAGTQDAAAIIGIKALGATSAQAVAYVVMLRFVIVVPITLAGLALLVTRYGGLGRLRTARA